MDHPIAFFCAEYALTSGLPIYAGGLGVLAGDYLKEADDQKLPVVAIGLYYNDGYQTLHKVDQKGFIEAPHVHMPPEEYGLSEVRDGQGNLLLVDVPIRDRDIKARAWKWNVGSIPVYLLNTTVDGNSEEDKKITDHLYVIDTETRFKQAIVLGIGGFRLLSKMGITPSLYHMNEGFSSLLCLEVVKAEMQKWNIGFDEARNIAASKIVFTNHTLVTSGHDTYSGELININLSKYITELGVGPEKIIEAGAAEGSTAYSTTLHALRFAGKSNAVSKIHAKKALEVWPNNPMVPITNGIHLESWNAVSSDHDIWQSHLENKRLLIEKINLLTKEDWDTNSLIIGWARRLVPYKRPDALFENIERLKKITSNQNRPVKIVISGTLHPSDDDAVEFFNSLRDLIDAEFAGYAVFLPGYDVALSKIMVAGCDVWLNTPIVGFEACGTSGMKAALNGVLPLSTRDGWMDEIDFYGIGWQLDSDRINESILNTLENEIIPLYFERNAHGVPEKWVSNMKNARNLIKERFSTTRMLKEYVEQLYQSLLSSQSPPQISPAQV